MARIPLTADELRLIRHHTQALLDGRHSLITEAARACLRDIARLKRRPGDRRPAHRSYRTVYTRISRATAGLRRGAHASGWTERERAVADRYVAALVEGRINVLADAAGSCLRDLRRLHRRLPADQRGARPRTWRGAYSVLRREAKRLGWTPEPEDWTEPERAVLARYVDALVRGRYRSAHAATLACRAELARLRGRRRRQGSRLVRSVRGLLRKLVAGAEKRGWTRDVKYWLPQESRILERHARLLLKGSGPDLTEVARQCCAALDRLYDRLRTSNPDVHASVRRRTYTTVSTYLDRRALALGRRFFDKWGDDELVIVNRHARSLIARRYKDAPSAARAALPELAALRQRWRRTDPDRYRRSRPRLLANVYRQVCASAHALGPRWPQTKWTPEELKILRGWVRWYERHRGVRRLHPVKTAAEGIHEELGRIDSLRDLGGVKARFWKEVWRRRDVGSS